MPHEEDRWAWPERAAGQWPDVPVARRQMVPTGVSDGEVKGALALVFQPQPDADGELESP